MATDYEEFYKSNPHGLGDPFPEFVNFFEKYNKLNANVLDLGAGQGRDSLFIAKKGHSVTAVDISKTGINQIINDARKINMPIKGIVEDITVYTPSQEFDVVIIDRTLHMLSNQTDRLDVLRKMTNYVVKLGYILIADEKKNIPEMVDLFETLNWKIVFHHKGFLFALNNE